MSIRYSEGNNSSASTSIFKYEKMGFEEHPEQMDEWISKLRLWRVD